MKKLISFLKEKIFSNSQSEIPLDWKEILHSLKRQAIHLCLQSVEETMVEVGGSKYGGRPDVPEDFLWPMDDAQRPLSLLLQINCEDLVAYDAEGLFPSYGRLYFFYELSEQDWEGAENSVRVLYDETPAEQLQRMAYPESLSQEFRLEKRAVCFEMRDSYPSLDDVGSAHPLFEQLWEQSDTYYELRDALQSDVNASSISLASMLGYADLIQNNVVDDLDENILLLQVPSVETAGMDELLFGDCGTIYFYISRQALKEKRFESIKFEMQCY